MTFEQWWQFAQTQTSDPLTDREKAIAAQAWGAALRQTFRGEPLFCPVCGCVPHLENCPRNTKDKS